MDLVQISAAAFFLLSMTVFLSSLIRDFTATNIIATIIVTTWLSFMFGRIFLWW